MSRYELNFTPTAIDDCTLWLRADKGIVAAAGAVTTWQDQSGNGNDVTNATTAQKPLIVRAAMNGRPALKFDGTNDYLTKTSATAMPLATDAWSYFLAIRPLAVPQAIQFPFGIARASGNDMIGANLEDAATTTALSVQYRVYGQSAYCDSSIQVYKNKNSILGATGTGTSITPYVNGVAAAATAVAPTATGAARINLGGLASASAAYNGYLAEVVMFSRVLTAAEITRLGRYFTSRYGT